MATLSLEDKKVQLAREKAKQNALEKKMEAQRNKEMFGEKWRKILQQELAEELQDPKVPHLYDYVDLYQYLDPITLYQDIKMDYNHFSEFESKYNSIIATQSKIMEKVSASNSEEDIQSILAEDGDTEENNILPNDPKYFASDASKAKAKLNQTVALFLNRSVPVYDKYVCSCCGVPKPLTDYYITRDISCAARVDNKGNYRQHVCKQCVQKMFNYYYTQVADKDLHKTFKLLCSCLNIYFKPEKIVTAMKHYEEKNRSGTLFGAYMSILFSDYSTPKVFLDSPDLTATTSVSQPIVVSTPLDWTAEEDKNKKDVIRLLGYDPFAYEKNDEDKKILYADFISILDEEIQQDYVKVQSALTIVKSFTKVRKLDEKLVKLEEEGASLKEQKDLADLKAKELKAISDFSRDSGFSERFKTKQSQGSTSFTGIMKTMNEKKYENELINKYDIQTSSTIQAAADASFKAIFTQLNLSDAEINKLAAEQLSELRKLRQENERLQEELRQVKYENTELKMIDKMRDQQAREGGK